VGLVLLILFSFTSHAQSISEDTLKIQEVQISAQRPIDEIGLVKTTIDTSIVKASESESLSELISENSSIFVKSAGRGALATVSFRGTSASHTDVLWNGMTIKSPMLGQVDFSKIPMFFIDDVSLLHGGASIQSSSGALGGSIQIDNKPNWDNKFALKFKQGFGSFTTVNDYLQVDLGNKKIQSKTRLFYNYSKNDFEFVNKRNADIDPKTGELIFPTQKNKNAEYLQYGLLQEVYIRFTQKYTLSLKYWGQQSNRDIPRLITYEGNDYSNISQLNENTHRIIADISRFGKHSKLNFSSGFVYSNMEFIMKNYVSGKGYYNALYSINESKSSYNKLSYTYRFSEKTKVSFNYEFNYHDVLSEDSIKNQGYLENRIENMFFLSWNQTITKQLSSVIMLRQNFIDNNTVPLIPYLGLDYRLWETYNLYAKASFSRNYRYPTLNDLYFQPGGNIDLKPEQGWTTDFSLSSRTQIKKIDIETSATAFYTDINDWIVWEPSTQGYWSPKNVKRVIAKGLELHFNTNFKLAKVSFKFNTNYSYTSSVNMDKETAWDDDSYGKQLMYVPVHSFNLFAQAYWKGFSLTYQNNSYGERFITSSNNVNKRDVLYPYFMNNLAVGKDFKIKHISFNLNFKIYNLFNEEYRSILHRAMPRQNYLLSLRISIS